MGLLGQILLTIPWISSKIGSATRTAIMAADFFPESDERRVLVVYAFSWGRYGGSGGRRPIDSARKTYELFNFFAKSARHSAAVFA